MSTNELSIQLFEMMIPHYCYSIGEEQDQRVCMVENSGKWLVYFCEDGEKLDLEEYADENAACEDVLRRLSE
ncbi:MAG: hypothetical protein E7478_01285 [Ruminococcaceae bacterium]|nr:hypothetical protein [Oscillospiraceae bacterium]